MANATLRPVNPVSVRSDFSGDYCSVANQLKNKYLPQIEISQKAELRTPRCGNTLDEALSKLLSKLTVPIQLIVKTSGAERSSRQGTKNNAVPNRCRKWVCFAVSLLEKGRVGPSGLTNRRLGIGTQHRKPLKVQWSAVHACIILLVANS